MPTETDSERAPLLGSGASEGPAVEREGTESHGLPPTSRDIPPARRLLIVILLFSLTISVAIGGTLCDTAVYELLEGAICRRIHGTPPYARAGDHENPCKDTDVQSELSFIMGWDMSIGLLPGLLLAVPYGAVADKYGRIIVVGLSLLGVTLSAGLVFLVCE